MKKIVFFNSSLDAGGPGTLITFWSHFLLKKNYLCEIVTNVITKPFYELDGRIKLTKLNVQKFKQKNIFFTFFTLKKFFYLRKEQVCIFNKAMYIPYIFLLKKFNIIHSSINLIYLVHGGSSDFKTTYNNFISQIIFHTFDSIVALHDDIKQNNFRIDISFKQKLLNILFSFDLNNFKNKLFFISNPIPFKSKNKYLYSSNIILSIGRLDKIKGYDILIDAWKIVNKKNKFLKLVIVGNGSESAFLKKKIINLKLDRSIEIVSEKKNVKSFYQKAAIFINSSFVEGLPIVLLEAMECGLPLIGLPNVGTKYMIRHNKNGLLLKNHDHLILAKNITELYNNPEKRIKMSLQSKAFAKKFYPDKVYKKWKLIF
ncbi:glycosyltransferase [Pelagibacteraceae bacterium]|nr:glycosyltransferase [Pelagibacteraceae bacterium]